MPRRESGATGTEAVADLLAHLAEADNERANAAGRALLALGAAVLPALIEAFPHAPVAARRRLAFLLGRVRSPGRTSVERPLLKALLDPDWKVRRNAAVALGRRRAPAAAGVLRERLEQEEDARVRPSLILAWGNIAAPSDLPVLEKVKEEEKRVRETPEEKAALAKVKQRLLAHAGNATPVDLVAPLPREVETALWCRGGLAKLVLQEAQEQGLRARVVTPDCVRVERPPDLATLLALRCALFPVLLWSSPGSTDPHDIGRAFGRSATAAALQELTPGVPAYRLTLDASLGVKRRREWIEGFASACPGLHNQPTGYSWELILRREGRNLLLGARPAQPPDRRFVYRQRDIPAALHPTLAAAAVRLLPCRPQDVVADPFCGSGTLLAERALRGPYRKLLGLDVDRRAVAAANVNLGALEHTSLVNAPADRLARLGPVSAILTNPPYGQRVGAREQALKTHAELDELAAAVLEPGGGLVVVRPSAFPSPATLKVERRLRVDAGGLPVDLLVARKD